MQFNMQTTARKNRTLSLNARKPQFFLPVVIREKNQNISFKGPVYIPNSLD